MPAETLQKPKSFDSPNLQDPAEKKKQFDGREQPNAGDAEKSIISSMMQSPQDYVAQALESRLTFDHFYTPAHGTLFNLLVESFEKNVAMDLIALSQALEDKDLLKHVGGPARLTESFYYASNHAHFPHHLNIVKDKFVLRSMVKTCNEAIIRAFEEPENVPELLDQVEAEVLKIREGSDTEKAITTRQAVDEVFELLQKVLKGEPGAQGTPTGYPDLDRMSGGLKGGDMFILAARPSMGKTSFVMNVVEHVAIDQNLPAMVFSLEMTTQQIVQRLLFSRARFAYSKLQKGFKPTKGDLQNISRASQEVANSKLFIDDTPSISINELRAKARRKHKDEGIKLIAVDYLQLMRSNSKQAQNSREREVAEISAGLKGLAKELGIPIIVLAQLNRGPEQRGGVPRMSDLRESGSIEQDADLIGLLYRTAYYAETEEAKAEEEGKAELIIGKNRNGETGHVPLTFIADLMRFETRAREAGEIAPE